jgi:hypothetical protein
VNLGAYRLEKQNNLESWEGRTGLPRLFWEFLHGGNFARTTTSKGSQREVLEDISSKCLAGCLIGYGRFKVKIALRQKKWPVKCHIDLRIIF